MQTILIYIIVYQLGVLHGDQTLQREMYAQIGSEEILTCKISNETSRQSWRKHYTQLTRGFEKNKRFLGHERLEIIDDRGFYNLKIYNITEYDFSTYWCETQQGNSITTEGTRLIHSDKQRMSQHSTLSDSSETKDSTDMYRIFVFNRQRISFQSTLSESSTSETTDGTEMYVGKSFFNGLCATGFVVLCLSVCGNCFFIKFRAAISRRKERNSDENESQGVLQGNGTNNDTANDTALGENVNVFSHYETINENELIGMSHPPTSQHLSNLPRVSNIVQSLKQDDMYLEVIEETNNQMLDPRTKINGDKDHVSSPREERNAARFIFSTKNEKDDKSNTINKEFPFTIEKNNFQDCKTSNNSISLSSSSTSEQSAGENIQERDKKASEHPNQYMSLNVNDMEYLNSYSTIITENKLRENESQNS